MELRLGYDRRIVDFHSKLTLPDEGYLIQSPRGNAHPFMRMIRAPMMCDRSAIESKYNRSMTQSDIVNVQSPDTALQCSRRQTQESGKQSPSM